MNDTFTVSPSIGDSRIVKPSQEALDAAVIREMLTGEEYRRKLGERKREQEAYKDACTYKGARSTKALGLCVASIPIIEFFAISQKEGGVECWGDRGFMRDFNKRFPHLSPNRA